MREVFADSGYWMAMNSSRDELHSVAQRVTDELAPCRIVTTEMVLVEFLNSVSKRGQHRRSLASDMVDSLENDPNVEVVPQTSQQFRDAVSRYASRFDQRWSLVDCASFVFMERRGITEALAHDRDFEQAGFVALLR